MSKSRYYDKGKHSSKRSTEREFPLTEEMKDLRVGISRIYAKDQEGIMFLQNGKSTIEVKYTATDPLETIKRVKKVLIEIQNVHK